MKRWTHAFAAATMVLLPLGCQSILGFEDFEQGGAGGIGATAGSGGSGATSGASGVGGAGGQAGDASVPCTSTNSPAEMVAVRLPSGTCVWVDKFEVSENLYAAFAAKVPSSLFNQPPCQAKKAGSDFIPGCGTDAAAPDSTQPVTCVDWCDAWAYCAANNKKLCPSDWTAPDDPEKSGWYAACSSNGQFAYPGSNTPDEAACNYHNNATWGCGSGCALAPVGATSCKTPHGVNDMSGNVAEWVDACASSASISQCQVRGGSVQKSSADSKCTSVQPVAREFRSAFTGFRCCWQP